MKARYVLMGVLMCSVLLLRLLLHPRQATRIAPEQEAAVATFAPTPTSEPKLSTPPPPTPEPQLEPVHELRPVKVPVEPIATNTKKIAPGLRIRENEKKLKILDSKGDLVMDLSHNPHFNGISSKCTVSENGRQILVDYGADAAYDVVEPETGLKISLPVQPPGKNKVGFGSWRWIDNDRLLGEAGDEVVNRKPGVEGEFDTVAQTRLYVYSVSRQKLTEVQLPKDFGVKVFSVAQVDQNGYVHLVHEVPNAVEPADLGWFEVRAK